MPKWTVIVEGREFPARPLVLESAGVLPNDPTNSHSAVALLQARGFTVRYEGKNVPADDAPSANSEAELDELIGRLRGSLKGEDSLTDFREQEHRIEKNR